MDRKCEYCDEEPAFILTRLLPLVGATVAATDGMGWGMSARACQQHLRRTLDDFFVHAGEELRFVIEKVEKK